MEKSLRIRLPDKLHRAAKIKAAINNTTMAEICRRALAEWVESDPPTPVQQEQKKPSE
ncbi:MAG: hypothetical protein H8D74_00565 [Chloroflexi bacterium]|nr:hypothetical protein [Chloroflexota bacterium]